MTAMAQTIDMSGVVSSILQSYEQALVAVQQQVTGDPAAVSAAGQQHTQQAAAVGQASSAMQQSTSSLAADWSGTAHDAFAKKSGTLTDSLAETQKSLTDQATRMSEIAQGLTTARQRMDSVLSQFRQIGQTLITESRTASPATQYEFIQAAQRLGESGTSAANGISNDLAAVLVKGTAIRKPDDAGFMNWELGESGRYGSLSWLGAKPLDPGAQPTNSFYRNSGLIDEHGNPVDPSTVKTPWGTGGDEDQGGVSSLLKGAKVTLWKPEDGTLYDNSLNGQDSTSGTLAGGVYQGQDKYYVGPHVTDGMSVFEQNGQVQATVSGKATLIDGSVAGAYDNGPLHAQAGGEALVGATGDANASIGMNGVSGHVGGFAGAEVDGQGSVDVGGIGVGGEAKLQAGIGAQIDGQATYSNGHLIVQGDVGATLGVGGTVGAHIDVDVPKIAGEVEQGASDAWNSVSTTAAQASAAIGRAWSAGGGAW